MTNEAKQPRACGMKDYECRPNKERCAECDKCCFDRVEKKRKVKQIKTIVENCNATFFDKEVNEALREGWNLDKRVSLLNRYIAELSREVETDAD